MTDHDQGPVWQEPGTFEAPPHPKADLPLQTETETTEVYIANLLTFLNEAARDPGAYQHYEELGVVYDAARAILLAAKEGKPVTPPIPYLTPELAALVPRLLDGRRSEGSNVSLPIRFDSGAGGEHRKAGNVTLAGWLISDFSLATRQDDNGQLQYFYSTFPWDKR